MQGRELLVRLIDMRRSSNRRGKFRTCRQLGGLIVFLLLGLVHASGVQAAAVGTFTEVEGQVTLLKSGTSQTVPAAAQAGVEMKDVIQTEAESRAQLRFLDDTTLAISPLSRITIESYLYEEKGKRQAVLEVAQGLVQVLVSKIFAGREPDFILKSQTAILGVRGTEFYVLVMENPSQSKTSGLAPDFLKNLRIRALEVPKAADVTTDVFVKSGRVIMSSSNPTIKATVLLGANQSSRVSLNRPPAQRTVLTQKDFRRLSSSMFTGVTPAQVGRTRTPQELLRKLPVTPPRPGKPLPGKGAAPGSSQSAPPLKSKMESSKPGVKQPTAATKPARVAPQKPGKKETGKAAPPKPKRETFHGAPNPPGTKMTPPKPAPMGTPRAAPPQLQKGPFRAAPAAPSKREPSRVTKPKPAESAPAKPAPRQKPGLPAD